MSDFIRRDVVAPEQKTGNPIIAATISRDLSKSRGIQVNKSDIVAYHKTDHAVLLLNGNLTVMFWLDRWFNMGHQIKTKQQRPNKGEMI